MRLRILHFIIAASGLAALPVPSASAAALATAHSAGDVVHSFLEQQCFDCHGDDAKKERMRLDQLPPDFRTREQTENWSKVLEKLQNGEMPPKKRPRPPEAERQQVQAWIEGNLLAAEQTRQRTEGRTVARRLNRYEYQNTVRDLLGIHVDLKDLLPEDTFSNGFDNIGDALTVSPVLTERYLDAAELAIRTALDEAVGPEKHSEAVKEPIKQRYTYKDQTEITRNTRYFRTLDDAVVFFPGTHLIHPTVLRLFHAPAAGLYRFRISAYAFQSPQPVAMAVFAGDLLDPKSQNSHNVGYYDMPPQKPRVVEFTERLLAPRQTIKIEAYGSKSAVGNKLGKADQALTYDGPGLAVQWVEVEGPLSEEYPADSFHAFLTGFDFSQGTLADAEKILVDFASRAFRRPVSLAELRPIRDLVAAHLQPGGYTFRKALTLGLQAVLCSQRFLFLDEKPGRLDDYALASRLSYFLWSTMPDKTLLALARQQKLHDPQTLVQQVERMLGDPKAQQFTVNFVGQWLDLRLIDFTTPDKKLYPNFDDLLKVSMLKETNLFFDEILKSNLSVLNFVDSDFTFLNETLARHYGVPGVKGEEEFRKVTLSATSHRGGVLTQAGVLKVTANGTATSPVTRGVWVLRKIVGQPPPPPPKTVPAIEPDIRGATTIREQLAKHRQDASCASCHARIDPVGFALENFDVLGAWRTNYRVAEPVVEDGKLKGLRLHKGAEIDASAQLVDGRSFKSIDEFKHLLCADKDQVARALTEQLLTYATGSPIHAADRPAVTAIVDRIRPANYGLRTMVHAIVQSPVFQSK